MKTTRNRTMIVLTLAALVIGSSSAVAGTIALIDLGRATNTTGTTGGVTYNDLSIGSGAPDTGPVPVVLNGAAATTSPAPLVDTSNAATGWTIALELVSTGTSGEWGNNGGSSAAPPYPASLSSIATTALQDNLYMNRNKRGRITLAGLDDGATYALHLYANETSNQGDASMSFVPVTGAGAGFVTTAIQARNNTTDVLEWDDVSPAGGVIAFDMQAAREGWQNFMSIEEKGTSPIPEPATMLAIGLGITGLGGYIRKRRRA